jgi:hypothetical protein
VSITPPAFKKFEFIFEKAVAPPSGAQDGRFNEKNRGSKISLHCPYKPLVVVVNKFLKENRFEIDISKDNMNKISK